MRTRRDRGKPAKAEQTDRQTTERFTFEALAGDPSLRGRARYVARKDATVRQTLADVDAAYHALGTQPDDAA